MKLDEGIQRKIKDFRTINFLLHLISIKFSVKKKKGESEKEERDKVLIKRYYLNNISL